MTVQDRFSVDSRSALPQSLRLEKVEIPSALLALDTTPDVVDVVILGAGCAGLSTAVALVDEGFAGSMWLIDGRTDFTDDRTWCFWNVDRNPFTDTAIGAMDAWSVRSSGDTVDSAQPSTPYLVLPATTFYQSALDRLGEASADTDTNPAVHLRLGERVLEQVEEGGVTRLVTDRGTVRARTVIDARGPRGPQRPAASTTLLQRFVGVRIRTGAPVFDPEKCMLMDFDVDQARGMHFMYVVPLSPREALVENVYFADTGPTEAGYRAEIDAYVADRFGLAPGEFVVDGVERGVIPMTDAPQHPATGPRRFDVGSGAGATRPSTGYAFLRIQRSARAIARAVVRDEPYELQLSPKRIRALDAVFLRFLRDHPERGPLVFTRMFTRTPPAPLVRFLCDTSRPRDELRLILALPIHWFLAAAVRTIWSRARARLHR
ncbi:lycopene cyclase family protein [Marisediminicola senii]|uniref:lycopene cyclase family protein n=1 Tax=Marisediminicola senii TaxID=2711233 RepID=UPI0013EB03CD|nr:lycopene cyclase family protein [Marisediminicola senii]